MGWALNSEGLEEELGCRRLEKRGRASAGRQTSRGVTPLLSPLLHRKPVSEFVRANLAVYYAS